MTVTVVGGLFVCVVVVFGNGPRNQRLVERRQFPTSGRTYHIDGREDRHQPNLKKPNDSEKNNTDVNLTSVWQLWRLLISMSCLIFFYDGIIWYPSLFCIQRFRHKIPKETRIMVPITHNATTS